MPTSEHPLLARLEEHFDSALAHHDLYRIRLEALMKFLPELADKLRSLAASHQAEITRADTAEARADAAEKERDDLKLQIAADEDTAKASLAVVDAELTAEAPKASAAPVVDTSAGTTTHLATDGTTTVLDHAAGTVTATDATGVPMTPTPAAVDAVVSAAVDAGVAVPEDVKPIAQAQPVI